MEKLLQQLDQIGRLDVNAMRQMRHRLNQLTKPLGSLGALEEIAIRLAGIRKTSDPDVSKKALVVMCGDHGVVAEGVSAFPQSVTGLMMNNFAQGGAAINVLARTTGATVRVVDVGSTLEKVPAGIIDRKVRPGTANIAKEAAMTKQEAVQAIQIGLETVQQLAKEGYQLLGLGEMGIGNTTPSSAIAAVFSGLSPAELTGRGTGISDQRLLSKCATIQQAIDVNEPNRNDPLDVLAKVGGLEIAALTGVVLGAAVNRLPVVIDGVIAGAAALVAYRIEPRCREYMLASHLSAEPAHLVLLEQLSLKPILHMDMRLGEGTGAALSFPLIESALSIAREMATFEDLGLPSPAPVEDNFSLNGPNR